MREGYRTGDTVSMRYAGGQAYEGKITAVDDGSGGGGGSGAGKGSSSPLPRPWWEGITLDWEAGGSVSDVCCITNNSLRRV